MFNSELKPLINAFAEGGDTLDHAHWTIPPVHHLKAVFHYDEPWVKGYPQEDKSLVGDYVNLARGLHGLHTIVSHCAQFHDNAYKILDGYNYNAILSDFFVQDCSRSYMQNMGVTCDDPTERRRRCGQFLDTFVKRA